MEQQPVVLITYVLVFILMSLAAAVFFKFSPIREEAHHKVPMRYFMLYFLFASLGYLVFMTKSFLPLELTIALSNTLSLTALYSLRTGFTWRSREAPEHLLRNKLFWGNLLIVLIVNIGIFHILVDSFLHRVFILLTNLALIYLSCLTVLYKDNNAPTKGENIVRAGLFYSSASAAVGIFPIALGANEFTFVSLTIVVWSSQIVLMLGALLTLSLSDVIDMHYRNSVTDPLTDLFNRRYFLQQAKILMKSAERHHFPISIILCDIDKFKTINDTFGHDVGDKAIINFAQCIKKAKRDEDILARFGGEEFILLLPQTTLTGAQQFAERLRQQIEKQSLRVVQGEISVTASFGVSTLSEKGNIEQQISHADGALYRAKKQGRNRVCTHESATG